MESHRTIIEAAHELASSLPGSTAEAVADAILTTGVAGLRAEIAKRVPHHHHRDLALKFVDLWRQQAADLDAQVVAVALQTAALSEQIHHNSQSVELVWTGPDVGDMPFRRTEQAILQLLDAARERITLVSFAVYKIPNVARALVKAAKRGVRLTVIVETPDKIESEGEYCTIRALGQDVTSCSSVYFWPKDKRPVGENGKVGILHVKCAVADGKWLFLSSANLTKQAFTVNMELGMLVRGGTMPGRVEQQFDQLIATKMLVGIPSMSFRGIFMVEKPGRISDKQPTKAETVRENVTTRTAADRDAANLLADAIKEGFEETLQIVFKDEFNHQYQRIIEVFDSEDPAAIYLDLPGVNERADVLLEQHAKSVAGVMMKMPADEFLSDSFFRFESVWEAWKFQTQRAILCGFDLSDITRYECRRVIRSLPWEQQKVIWLFMSRYSLSTLDDRDEELIEELFQRVSKLAYKEPQKYNPDEDDDNGESDITCD